MTIPIGDKIEDLDLEESLDKINELIAKYPYFQNLYLAKTRLLDPESKEFQLALEWASLYSTDRLKLYEIINGPPEISEIVEEEGLVGDMVENIVEDFDENTEKVIVEESIPSDPISNDSLIPKQEEDETEEMEVPFTIDFVDVPLSEEESEEEIDMPKEEEAVEEEVEKEVIEELEEEVAAEEELIEEVMVAAEEEIEEEEVIPMLMIDDEISEEESVGESNGISVEIEGNIADVKGQEMEEVDSALQIIGNNSEPVFEIDLSTEVEEVPNEKISVEADHRLPENMTFTQWLQNLKVPDSSNKIVEKVKTKNKVLKKIRKQTLKKKKEKEKLRKRAAISVQRDDNLISETLADVYASQGHREIARNMYEKLSLKFPEKSTYFAKKIESLKK